MTPRDRRLSVQALELLAVLLENPAEEHYGLDLGKRAGLLTGTVYPLLRRFEHAGWLESHLEDVDPSAAGRPPRVLYRLTGEGERAAAAELARLERLLPSRRPVTGLT
jgi:DNA-binding PadR family transcriptional regulator